MLTFRRGDGVQRSLAGPLKQPDAVPEPPAISARFAVAALGAALGIVTGALAVFYAADAGGSKGPGPVSKLHPSQILKSSVRKFPPVSPVLPASTARTAPPGVTPAPPPAPTGSDAGSRAQPSRSQRGTQRFFLQVGAFTRPERCAAVAHDLEQKGYRAHILAGDDYRRVVVGPFATKSEAAYARAELEKQGYQTLTR